MVGLLYSYHHVCFVKSASLLLPVALWAEPNLWPMRIEWLCDLIACGGWNVLLDILEEMIGRGGWRLNVDIDCRFCCCCCCFCFLVRMCHSCIEGQFNRPSCPLDEGTELNWSCNIRCLVQFITEYTLYKLSLTRQQAGRLSWTPRHSCRGR